MFRNLHARIVSAHWDESYDGLLELLTPVTCNRFWNVGPMPDLGYYTEFYTSYPTSWGRHLQSTRQQNGKPLFASDSTRATSPFCSHKLLPLLLCATHYLSMEFPTQSSINSSTSYNNYSSIYAHSRLIIIVVLILV